MKGLPKDLPQDLARLAEAGGLELAAGFARAFGGRRIYVPAPDQLTERHRLVKGLAREGLTLKDARVVANVLGGYVDVAFGPFAGPDRRRRAAREMLKQGVTKSEIAEACEMTERTVYRLQAKPALKSKNRDFFED